MLMELFLWGAQIYAHAYFCLNAHTNVSVGPIKMISLLKCFCFHKV